MPWIGLILGYGLLTHGIILLNDGIFWDWWMMEAWQRNRDKDSMRRFFSEVGMPNLYVEHWLLGYVPWRRMIYRFISLASLLLIAAFVFLIVAHTSIFNIQQAAVLALLLISYPAYSVTFDGHVSLQYTFKVMLFYAGGLLAVTTLNQSGVSATFLFVAALVLFLWSFTANATLVYFGGFLLFYAWLASANATSEPEVLELIKIVLMVSLPVIYWIIKEKFAPRHGYYKDYNRLNFGRLSILREVAIRALRLGIDVPMVKATVEIFRSRKISLIFASLFLGLLLLDWFRGTWAIGITEALVVLFVGYALLGLCALPFMLVGQMFSEGGWGAKNFMLFHLPFALIAFGWLQMFPQSFGVVLVPLILIANALHIVKTHLLYIALSVKDKALFHHLTPMTNLSAASVIKVRDTHWYEYPFERIEEVYRPVYLSYMFKVIWPDSCVLGVLDKPGSTSGQSLSGVEIETELEQTTTPYGIAPHNSAGPQYLVTVASPENRFSLSERQGTCRLPTDISALKQNVMIHIALKYLFRRMFTPARLPDLFHQHFSIKITRL